jgi:hypothetical protein
LRADERILFNADLILANPCFLRAGYVRTACCVLRRSMSGCNAAPYCFELSVFRTKIDYIKCGRKTQL